MGLRVEEADIPGNLAAATHPLPKADLHDWCSLMNAPERVAAISILITVDLGALVALAGSDGGAQFSGFPVFAVCAAVSFGINWIVFVPSFAARTEHFFDLTGSLTYLSLLAVALLLTPGELDLRSILLAGLIFVWAARLGSFLFLRIRKAGEDPRFKKIKQSFLRFLMVWTLQGLWVLLTAACALSAMTSSDRVPLGSLRRGWSHLVVDRVLVRSDR